MFVPLPMGRGPRNMWKPLVCEGVRNIVTNLPREDCPGQLRHALVVVCFFGGFGYQRGGLPRGAFSSHRLEYFHNRNIFTIGYIWRLEIATYLSNAFRLSKRCLFSTFATFLINDQSNKKRLKTQIRTFKALFL